MTDKLTHLLPTCLNLWFSFNFFPFLLRFDYLLRTHHTICRHHHSKWSLYKYKFWMNKKEWSCFRSNGYLFFFFFAFLVFISFDGKTFEWKFYLVKVVYVECFLYDAIWYNLNFVNIIRSKKIQNVWISNEIVFEDCLFLFTRSVSTKLINFKSVCIWSICM